MTEQQMFQMVSHISVIMTVGGDVSQATSMVKRSIASFNITGPYNKEKVKCEWL